MKWKSSPAELYGLSHINYNVNVCVLSLKGPTLFMPQGLLSNNYNTLTTLKGEQDFIWHFLVMYDKVLNLYVILIIIPWPFFFVVDVLVYSNITFLYQKKIHLYPSFKFLTSFMTKKVFGLNLQLGKLCMYMYQTPPFFNWFWFFKLIQEL